MSYRPTDAEIRELFTGQNKRHEEMTAFLAGYNLNGYPIASMNIMEHSELNRLAAKVGMVDPDYVSNPREVYAAAQKALGAMSCCQWIPENPLTMGQAGYEHGSFSATTGAKVILDGVEIEDPDDVAEHLEKVVFPRLKERIANYDKEARVREIGLSEYDQQMEFGLDILKYGYDYIQFPILNYYAYGYENYFCAYAMYPELIDEHFRLQAELCYKNNDAAAEAINRYDLPRGFLLDHDMCDGRGTLVSLKSLEQMWFPRFEYCLRPILEQTSCRMLWHCDGDVRPMVPGLIECGVVGFQGFQYEYGVDFAELCKLHSRDGSPLSMYAGVSVTRTLPYGTPEQVRKELDDLVEVHGDTALMLGATSSVLPGVPSANIDALIEGLAYYRTHRK